MKAPGTSKQANKQTGYCEVAFLQGRQAPVWADYLTRADLSGWFKIQSPGEMKLSLSLDFMTRVLAF